MTICLKCDSYSYEALTHQNTDQLLKLTSESSPGSRSSSISVSDMRCSSSACRDNHIDLGIVLQTKSQIFQKTIQTFEWRSALDSFALKFPTILPKLFQLVGVYPVAEHQMVFNPYTNTHEAESYANIGVHCLAVATAAKKILAALPETVHRNIDGHHIIERALVHDIGKPYEIMRRNAAKKDAYDSSSYIQLEQQLKNLSGFNASDALKKYIAHAGEETGHNSLSAFISTDKNGRLKLIEGRLAEKIIHLADDMTFTSIPQNNLEEPITCFLTPQERMIASEFKSRYSWMWHKGIGITEDRKILNIDNINSAGKYVQAISYADLQCLVAKGICKELQILIDPASNEDPELFVKAIVNKTN